MSYSGKIMEYINSLPSISSIHSEIEDIYRMYVYHCDNLVRIHHDIDLLQNEVAYQENKLKKVNSEIKTMRSKYFDSPRNFINYDKTNAKFHNFEDIFYPTNHNVTYVANMQLEVVTVEELSHVIHEMCSYVCTGDVIYLGSILKSTQERFAIVTPLGKVILHDDLMTILFDKSINTNRPVPYDFIKERNIKYGNMFQFIMRNRENSTCKEAYNCSFNNWRSNEEVEQILKYYVDNDLWK